jgi:hypothetical protein
LNTGSAARLFDAMACAVHEIAFTAIRPNIN